MSCVNELSAKDLAHLLGVSEPSIFLWAKGSNWLSPAKVARGKYDGKLAVRLYIKHQVEPKFRHGKDGGESFEEARRRKEIAQANLHELKEGALRGELIEKDQAVKWIIVLVSEAKTAFLALPRRLAPMLYGISDIRQIENEIRVEIMKILEKLGRSIDKKGAKKPAVKLIEGADEEAL